MIKHVTSRAKKPSDIVFIQLRDEPLVFINNTPYVLRDTNQPFKPFVGTRIDKDHLYKLEEKASQEVRYEKKILFLVFNLILQVLCFYFYFSQYHQETDVMNLKLSC